MKRSTTQYSAGVVVCAVTVMGCPKPSLKTLEASYVNAADRPLRRAHVRFRFNWGYREIKFPPHCRFDYDFLRKGAEDLCTYDELVGADRKGFGPSRETTLDMSLDIEVSKEYVATVTWKLCNLEGKGIVPFNYSFGGMDMKFDPGSDWMHVPAGNRRHGDFVLGLWPKSCAEVRLVADEAAMREAIRTCLATPLGCRVYAGALLSHERSHLPDSINVRL